MNLISGFIREYSNSLKKPGLKRRHPGFVCPLTPLLSPPGEGDSYITFTTLTTFITYRCFNNALPKCAEICEYLDVPGPVFP